MTTSIDSQKETVPSSNPIGIHDLTDSRIAVLAAVAIAVALCLRYLARMPQGTADIPLYLALGLGGAPLLWRLGLRLLHREFGSDLLAGLSIVTAALTGQYLAGTIIVLMLAGGTALETYATDRAHSALNA